MVITNDILENSDDTSMPLSFRKCFSQPVSNVFEIDTQEGAETLHHLNKGEEVFQKNYGKIRYGWQKAL